MGIPQSQEELRRIVEPGQFVPLESYTCLVKASWILVDIIACHPQVPFLPARMHSEVQMLSSVCIWNECYSYQKADLVRN